MASEEWSARSRSFGAIAERYDRFRPGPPPEAVEWLLGGRVASVLDIGAGTGALTRGLGGRADRVAAAEPDVRMAAVLAARGPAVETVSARAEALPFAGATFDAVVGASMWHWVDEPRAVGEVARVLRDGGVFGLLWNGPDWSSDAVAGLLVRRNATVERDEARPRRRHEVHLPPHAPFRAAETRSFTWSLSLTLDEIVGLAGTYSQIIRLPDAERADLDHELRAAIAQRAGVGGRDRIPFPMGCFCWRTTRLARA